MKYVIVCKHPTSLERRFCNLLNRGYTPVKAWRSLGYSLNHYKKQKLSHIRKAIKYLMSTVERNK